MAAKKSAVKTAKAETPAADPAPAPVAKKAAKKAPALKEATATKKAPAAKKEAKPAAAAPAKSKPSPDEIARAAYLNYRSRVENGLPGDSSGDWLFAEKQLGLIP